MTAPDPGSSTPAVTLTVLICTRDRPDFVQRALRAIDAQQSPPSLEIIVVDQSTDAAPDLLATQVRHHPLRVIPDPGRGVSRARNIGLSLARGEWVALLDDDCMARPDWARSVMLAAGEHPEADLVGGPVEADDRRAGEVHAVALREVPKSRLIRGRLTWPLAVGYGMNIALRRTTATRLGGWDERLGPGTSPFLAGEDLDFNHRFLRAGGVALASPLPRVVHLQWREREQLAALHRDYLAGAAACAVKYLRSGDPLGGAVLWARLLFRVSWMAIGAVRSRSTLHRDLARAHARGLWSGTRLAASRPW